MSALNSIISTLPFKLQKLPLCSSVHTVLFPVPLLNTFCYPASSVCILCSGNTKFLKWIMLQIDI